MEKYTTRNRQVVNFIVGRSVDGAGREDISKQRRRRKLMQNVS